MPPTNVPINARFVANRVPPHEESTALVTFAAVIEEMPATADDFEAWLRAYFLTVYKLDLSEFTFIGVQYVAQVGTLNAHSL